VTVSSSEAAFIAILEVGKKTKFINYFIQGIGIKIELPFIVKIDHIGAMFIVQKCLIWRKDLLRRY
jgi:hypothetical protein